MPCQKKEWGETIDITAIMPVNSPINTAPRCLKDEIGPRDSVASKKRSCVEKAQEEKQALGALQICSGWKLNRRLVEQRGQWLVPALIVDLLHMRRPSGIQCTTDADLQASCTMLCSCHTLPRPFPATAANSKGGCCLTAIVRDAARKVKSRERIYSQKRDRRGVDGPP
jgi:hypothetical protein